MYVVVQHRIKDPKVILARVEEGAPPGLTPRQFLPSADLSTATCLWEAGSVEAVQDFIESTLGDSSENSYFEVSSEHAIGLPQPAATGA